MVALPLGVGAWDRPYGKAPPIKLVNRFFEANPANRANGVSLLSRPGTTYTAACGAGPIRANFTQDGTFDGDLFTVSGERLFRFDRDTLARTSIAGTVGGAGNPVMAGTNLYLFIADGASLQFYDGVGSRAQGVLTVSANPGDTETVTINGVAYTFNTTLGGANSVQIGATAGDTLQNFCDAINAAPEREGIAYGVGTVENPFVYAWQPVGLTLTVNARIGGVVGNAYTLAETLANGAWSGTGTMAGGVADGLSGIPTPDDVGIVSLAVCKGFVLCVAAQSQRVYLIRPGEFLFRPVPDFFEAESVPDEIISAMTVGDQVWLFGTESTEVVYPTGDDDAPFAPIQGRAFSRGVLEGTPILLDDTVMVVGDDDVVYQVRGGPERVSNHGIEDLIRQARKIERDAP